MEAPSMHATISEKHLMYSNHAKMYIIRAMSGAVASCRQAELNYKAVKMHQLQTRAVN